MEEIIDLKLSKVNFYRRWNFETKPTSRLYTYIHNTQNRNEVRRQ